MTGAWLIGMVLAGASPPDGNLAAVDLKTYEDAKAHAQRDPDAHVRLALWCEAHGLDALRLKHLAIAVLASPQNATARGLLGLVSYRGQWQKPEAVSEKMRSDAELAAALAEYNDKRAKTPVNPDAQWQLALWCEQKGLKAEATAHLATVVRLDPAREAAWKHLGFKKHGTRWMSDAQVAAEKAEAEAQVRADRHWQPLLEKWRNALGQKDKKAEAEKQLAAISDPRAVPSIVRAFASGGANLQLKAVQILGQVDAPTASRALAVLAIFSPSAEVRQAAVETLKNRDARDYVGLWIGLIRKPLKYEVRPVGGPGSPGVLFVDGERFNLQRFYVPPPLPPVTQAILMQLYSGAYQPLDPSETKTIRRPTSGRVSQETALAVSPDSIRDVREMQLAQILAENQRAAASSQQQLQNDIAWAEATNTEIHQANLRILQALNDVTGQELGEGRGAWDKWWTDQRGYAYQPPPELPKPTFQQTFTSTY